MCAYSQNLNGIDYCNMSIYMFPISFPFVIGVILVNSNSYWLYGNTATYMYIINKLYNRGSLDRPPHFPQKIWFCQDRWSLLTCSVMLKCRCFCKNVWSVKTDGLSWQWSLKTGFTKRFTNLLRSTSCVVGVGAGGWLGEGGGTHALVDLPVFT